MLSVTHEMGFAPEVGQRMEIVHEGHAIEQCSAVQAPNGSDVVRRAMRHKPKWRNW